MEPNTEMIILGVTGDGSKLNTFQNSFFNYGLIIAKKTYTQILEKYNHTNVGNVDYKYVGHSTS